MSEQAARTPTAGRAPATGRDGVEFSRVVAFTDGVFAIAMTLLVLGIEVAPGSDDLVDALLDQWQSLFAYALSFAVLARLWLSHHELVGRLERFDGTLMGVNLLYLAFVALVPFTSQVLGDYGDQTAAVVVYASGIIGVMGTFAWQLAHGYRRRLIADHERDNLRRGAPGVFAAVIVFAASIPVAFVSPAAATLMWLGTLPVGDRLGRPLVRRALGD